MISFRIKDVKNFMSNLLLGDTFDFFSLSEAAITTYNTFQINGHINKTFFDSEDYEALSDKEFSSWSVIKPICYNLIKGHKTPQKMKLTFRLPDNQYQTIINKSGATLLPENISGLYVHFIYEQDILTAVTAASLSIFSMDKTIDKYWDNQIYTFLNARFDIEESQ